MVNESLGARIIELRKARGLTQRQLADAVGINFTYLSKIENNSLPYPPSAKTLEKLASQLNVEKLELLRLAHRLPSEIETIVNTEAGMRFLRQASKLQGREEWEELLAFLEGKRKGKKT